MTKCNDIIIKETFHKIIKEYILINTPECDSVDTIMLLKKGAYTKHYKSAVVL